MRRAFYFLAMISIGVGVVVYRGLEPEHSRDKPESLTPGESRSTNVSQTGEYALQTHRESAENPTRVQGVQAVEVAESDAAHAGIRATIPTLYLDIFVTADLGFALPKEVKVSLYRKGLFTQEISKTVLVEGGVLHCEYPLEAGSELKGDLFLEAPGFARQQGPEVSMHLSEPQPLSVEHVLRSAQATPVIVVEGLTGEVLPRSKIRISGPSSTFGGQYALLSDRPVDLRLTVGGLESDQVEIFTAGGLVHRMTSVELLGLLPGPDGVRRIQVGYGSQIRGQVLDGKGRPVTEGVLVMLTLIKSAADDFVEDPALASRMVPVDKSGNYRFLGIPAGLYLVGVESKLHDHTARLPCQQPIVIARGETKHLDFGFPSDLVVLQILNSNLPFSDGSNHWYVNLQALDDRLLAMGRLDHKGSGIFALSEMDLMNPSGNKLRFVSETGTEIEHTLMATFEDREEAPVFRAVVPLRSGNTPIKGEKLSEEDTGPVKAKQSTIGPFIQGDW